MMIGSGSNVGGAGAAHPLPRAGSSAGLDADALFASDDFRMFAYKIVPCPKKSSHEWTNCPWSHPGEKARRRDPRTHNYLAIPCEATKQGGTCPRGNDCPNCHSLFEYWLHPSRYRTQLCRDMENGHCKRQVCFFAHSIEELRVPDHSHLNIPPEMQQAAAGAGGAGSGRDSSCSQASTDTAQGSGGSTPRAAKPGLSASKLRPGSSSTSSQSPLLPGSGMQWAAGSPVSAAMMMGAGSNGYYHHAAAAALQPGLSLDQQQRAMLQLQQYQMAQQQQQQQQQSSMYEQHLQLLAAAERSAQQTTQFMMMQQHQQQQAAAATWTAQYCAGDACGVAGGSPALSSGSVLDRSSSFGTADSRSYFVPPSASSSTLSAMAAAGAGSHSSWQASGSLMRTASTPAHAGLLTRQASGSAGLAMGGSNRFASSGNGVAMLHPHHSAGSSVSTQQDMTLASLLGCSSPGAAGGGSSTWSGSAQPQHQMARSAAGGMDSYLAASAGLDAANLMVLQQHQQQQRGDLMQSHNSMLGAMMQQLMLQQQPTMGV